jgi:fused signal recognition particle receptor
LFDLLKNKFKSFTDKLFGKAQETIAREPSETGSVEEEVKEEQLTQTISEQAQVQEPTTQDLIVEPQPELVVEEVAQEPAIVEISKSVVVEKPKEKEAIKPVEVKVPKLEPIKFTEEKKEIEIHKIEIEEEPKLVIAEVPKVKKEKDTLIVGQTEEVKSVVRELSETGSPKEKHSIFDIFKPKPKPVVIEPEKPKVEAIKVQPKPIIQEELKPVVVEVPKEELEDLTIKKSTEIKKSLVTSIKSIFSSKVKLSEKEISEFLEEFELSLLEADVSIVSAENICKDLKEKLIQSSFSKENPLEDIKEHIRESLKTQLDIDCDINNYINKTKKENQPFVIMFIGPNGAGKTTTISKFAYHYKQKGKAVVLASGDTFRAGSIDQLEKHADTIGVKLVKQAYGSDPAAVAFDAVTSAKSSKADYVFIDTAGRQENNINLMQELKKIKRVVSPNLTIYIGEAQAGQAIVDQVSGFEKEIGVDGVILTKLDTDPKGGVAISILNELKKPIFYVGTGQTYNDLEEFSPEFIIKRII